MTHSTKGHWPKGRRRNEIDARVWAALRTRLVELLDEYPERSVRSRRALATIVGRDVRTVCRWLSGEDFPDRHSMAKLRAWHQLHRAAVRAARRRRAGDSA